MGAIPGIGASVIDWISYGHALRTEKGAQETFGKGDVRGVIAAESATNAREGGALVPTVAFGVPASAGMAILLGAFLIHGLVPGPEMLTKHLDITYSMVWSIAIANILGSGLCFLFSGQLAKIATLRYTLFMPGVLSLVYIGAFEASRNWGDLYSLLFFGVLGWAMKHFKWPRPPLVLGFILGDVLERYMFISIERYGVSWMLRPVVVVMFTMAGLSLLRPLLQDIRIHGGLKKMVSEFGHPIFASDNLFPAALLCLFSWMLTQSFQWSFAARIIPTIVGVGALLFCTLSLLNEIFGLHERNGGETNNRCRRQGDRAKDPHGHCIQDRASARQCHSRARRPVLRLDAQFHGRHGGDRAHSDGADLHHLLHAVRGPRAVEDRHPDGRRHGAADLRRVRSAAGDSVAADLGRHVFPGAEGHSQRIGRGLRALPSLRAGVAAAR